MNRLPKLVLLPAITIVTLLFLFVSLNLTQQTNALTISNSESPNGTTAFLQAPFPPIPFLNPSLLSPLQLPLPCYGPHMTANISKTQANINETVIVTGAICPPKQNATVIVTFVRPDYSYVNLKTLADDQTGKFYVELQLDMAGLWNIFPIENHITDRLFVNVTDPSGSAPALVAHQYPPPAESTYAGPVAVVAISAGATTLAIAVIKKDKTRKISSLRLLVQIGFVFLLFAGIFPGTIRLPEVPSAEIARHELLLGTDILNGALPDGLPIPTFGCYYPCGRVATCVLWQIQTYIYPFWDAGHGWAVDYPTSGLVRLGMVFGVIILASVVLGRVWCGWVCPFGLYLDLVTRLRKALKIKHRILPHKFNEKFHQLSYVILAATLVLSIIFASQAISGTQLISGTEQGGFVYTYFSAPFCQVCPMKPLCLISQGTTGIMRPEWITGTTTGDFWQLGQYLTSLNLAILAIVTAAAFFFRRSWCRICPLGALIALFNRYPPFKWISGVKLEKSEEKCTKCGVCKSCLLYTSDAADE